MVTIRDVAKRASVSPGLVSRVLNDKPGDIPISSETVERIKRAAKELGYRPNLLAKRLTLQKSHVIGVVIPGYEIFRGYVNSEILRGIGFTLDQKGYSLELFSAQFVPDFEKTLDRKLMGKLWDGVLVYDLTLTEGFQKTLVNANIPFCHIHIAQTSQNTCAVCNDNIFGARLAVEHLIEQGHRSIMIVCNRSNTELRERLEGYMQACSNAGIEQDEERIVHGALETRGIDTESFYRALQKCTAIFATSDDFAIVSYKLLAEKGLAPGKDIAVVGFDDIETAKSLTPSLTTIRQNGYEVGCKAASLVLDNLENEKIELQVVISKPELVIRESSVIGRVTIRR